MIFTYTHDYAGAHPDFASRGAHERTIIQPKGLPTRFGYAARAEMRALGLTTRGALEKATAVQMIGVHIPTTDGREAMLTPPRARTAATAAPAEAAIA